MYEILDKFSTGISFYEGEPFRGTDGRYHYVYLVVNKITGSFYIGKHTTSKLNDGYLGSSKYLDQDISTLGKENFVSRVVSYHKSAKEAYDVENSLITESMILSENCYNRNSGGAGFSGGKFHPMTELAKHGLCPGSIAWKENRHPWQLNGHPTTKKIAAGTHHFQGKDNPTYKRSADGTQKLHAERLNKRRFEDGTHNWIGDNHPSKIRVANGTHHLLKVPPWKNVRSNENAKRVWAHAQKVYQHFVIEKMLISHVGKLLETYFRSLGYTDVQVAARPLGNMVKKFNSGWIPENDSEWVQWQSTYKVIENVQNKSGDNE